MVNFGDSGTGYWRGHSTSSAFYQRIQNIPTDTNVVTIFGSFNDLGTEGGTTGADIIGDVTDDDTSTICGCINTTLDNLFTRCPSATVGVISPTPWYNHYGISDTKTMEYLDKLETICKIRSIPFLNLYKESNLMPWDSTFCALYYVESDGVRATHPNTYGHQRITPMIESFLKSICY